MIVYKQNVGDVCRELSRVLGDMEVLASMYTLETPLILCHSIVDVRHAREMLIELHNATVNIKQIDPEVAEGHDDR